jgi:hypothetical protein
MAVELQDGNLQRAQPETACHTPLWTGLFGEDVELNSKAGEERLNQLDRYFEAVQSVILARQHPVTSRSNYWLRRASHNSENDHLVCLRSGLHKTVELSASALSSRSVALSCAMGITSKRESATTRRWQL